MVVRGVAITMAAEHPLWSRPDEGVENQHVDPAIMPLAIPDERYSQMAVPDGERLQHARRKASMGDTPSAIVFDVSGDAADATEV
jgi:hypothetical protein